jgi:hypothetical protein
VNQDVHHEELSIRRWDLWEEILGEPSSDLFPLNVFLTNHISIDISSIVGVALSDHHNVFCTTLMPIAQGKTESIIKKHYLSSEVATDCIECMNNTPPAILASSCDDLVDDFNSKLRATLMP